MNEQCWILTGQFDEAAGTWRVQAKHQASGQTASVEADWHWTLTREEEQGDVAGFAHTHPAGAGTIPSARDVRTMQAWCSALGKPLLCLIAEGASLLDPAAYHFADDESEGSPAPSFELADIEPSQKVEHD